MTSTHVVRPSVARPVTLSTGGVAVLAFAAAVATSTSYVLQPELHDVAGDLDIGLTTMGVLAALPVVGYLVGLALLVPLADRIRSHRLVGAQLAARAVALTITALAPSAPVLGAGLCVSGLCASTGAQMSSLAGRYAHPERRGRVVGTVTAGISSGIVLGRVVGGTLADWCGWRVMLLVCAGACLVFALAACATLPQTALRAPRGYLATVTGLPRIVRSHRALRVSAVAGALWFFAFSLMWVGFSIALAGAPLHLSSARIGVYSLVGLLGVAATRVAGAAADRLGTQAVIRTGLLVAVGCAVVMSRALEIVPVLLIALAVFDAGLFSAQVANQSGVLAIDPTSPARFNSAYMVIYFVGGSAGTAIGGTVVGLLGWAGVGGIAAVAIVLALLIGTRGDRDTQRTPERAHGI